MKPFIVSAVLHRLRRYPRWSWFGVLFYAAIVILPHENVQTWVGEIAKSVGRQRVYQVAASIAIIGAAAVTFAVLRRLREQTERRMLGGFWLLTLALVVATWRLLTANNTELVHYPQYMVEGAAILALTLSPVETLCWIALFGGLDEDFQYWILHGNWGIPYDFNDIYMDLLGGALGAVVAMSFLPCVRAPEEPMSELLKRIARRPGVVVMAAIVTTVLILLATGRALLYQDPSNTHYWFALSRKKFPGFWFFDDTWGPHTFHTLTPIEGPILIFATIALFAVLERRVRVLAKP